MKIYNLEIGDIYDDGHGKTERFIFESDLTLAQIKSLWDSACFDLGFNLFDQFRDYDESTLKSEFSKNLENYLGQEKLESIFEYDETPAEREYYFWPGAISSIVSEIITESMRRNGVIGTFKDVDPDHHETNILSCLTDNNCPMYGLFD